MQPTSACFGGIEMLGRGNRAKRKQRMKAEQMKISIRFFNESFTT
jgi:hypothetical protein